MRVSLVTLLVLSLLFAAPFALGKDSIPLRQVDSEGEYTIRLTRVLRLPPPEGLAYQRYRVQQGAATDGTYAYLVMENQTKSLCSIWKVDLSDWSVVQTRYDLPIDHGNSLCYNDKLGLLVAVHNKPNYDTVSFIDPNTLQITGTRKTDTDMYCIGYDGASDRYVVGVSGTYDFKIMDADFSHISYHAGVCSGLVRQGVDCDGKYIYFAQNSADESVNQIVVYDWEGHYVNTVRVVSYQEIEELFHVGEDLYIAFNASGAHVYKACIDQDADKK